MTKPISLLDQLRRVSVAYCRATGLVASTVSRKCFNDGNKLVAILDHGADLTTARFEMSLQWFADNWPKGTPWPDGCKRPARQRESA